MALIYLTKTTKNHKTFHLLDDEDSVWNVQYGWGIHPELTDANSTFSFDIIEIYNQYQ